MGLAAATDSYIKRKAGSSESAVAWNKYDIQKVISQRIAAVASVQQQVLCSTGGMNGSWPQGV
jgi:hypothetical protein